MILHGNIVGNDVHNPFRWIVLNQSERQFINTNPDGSPITEGNLYSLLLQLDNNTVYFLSSVSPIKFNILATDASGVLTNNRAIGIETDTSGFDKVLSSSDTSVQKALDTLNSHGVHLTSLEKRELTSGTSCTYHYHVTDRSRDNHTGTQLASTISDLQSAVQSLVNDAVSSSFDATGATMNGDTDVSGNSWVLSEDNMFTDSTTKVPTQHSVKKYVDDHIQLASDVPVAVTGFAKVLTINDTNVQLALSTLDMHGHTADDISDFDMAVSTNSSVISNTLRLETIEDGADVTDPVRVAAAGAVMESDTTTADMSFVLDEDDFVSDSDESLATQQSIKAYVDNTASIQWIEVSALYYASKDDGILADTTTASFSIVLPLNPEIGDTCYFSDYKKSWPTHYLTILRNGSKIDSVADDLICDVSRTLVFVYANEIIGWVVSGYELAIEMGVVFSDSDKAKLDSIEEDADVTDATNVAATGATFDDDTDVSGNAWVLDEDDFASDSDTKVPTQQSVKEYIANNTTNNISDLDAVDLTDSGDTTLHYHSSDRDRANHTGTQTASTISDFDTEVSNNSDVASNTAHRNIVVGNPHSLDKTDIGLGNVTNNEQIPLSQKGTTSGVAELDASGKVPAAQLPSFVDDVLEYAAAASFPATGESGKIYVSLDTDETYRWSGTAYVKIGSSLALGETSTTAYRGDRGKLAYDHSQSTHAPTGAEANNISDTDAIDLTDGGESTLHYHDSDRDRANHTGTQTASTISDFDTEVSNNSSVTANTQKISYPSTDATKVGHITVTQAVNLDTIESNTATNNGKVTNATHTGDVSGATVLTIGNDKVTYAKMQNVSSNNSILGRVSGANGNTEELNATQVRTLINVEDGANNYSHPTHAGDDFSIDSGAMSGAKVLSDIDINVTTDSLGHVTDANATIATRNLTPANIGAVNKSGDTMTGDLTVQHTSADSKVMVKTDATHTASLEINDWSIEQDKDDDSLNFIFTG